MTPDELAAKCFCNRDSARILCALVKQFGDDSWYSVIIETINAGIKHDVLTRYLFRFRDIHGLKVEIEPGVQTWSTMLISYSRVIEDERINQPVGYQYQIDQMLWFLGIEEMPSASEIKRRGELVQHEYERVKEKRRAQ